ncbi:MAG: DUF2892 domain-containing protein [Chitinophagaceae bacterium]|nr:DUF2892 domain-containing protein [Chitinophagaceae bacterium]
MKKNMGNADRIIRLLLAAVFAVLYFTNTVTGTFGIILLVLGAVFVLTSLISFCPLYTIVGLNTCPAKNNNDFFLKNRFLISLPLHCQQP